MNVAILLSGGVGTRLGGDIPKQYLEVCGKMIIIYALESLYRNKNIDSICIVADKKWHDRIEEGINAEVLSNSMTSEKKIFFAQPGRNRQDSIINGMKEIKIQCHGADTVFVHDAARPALSDDLINACFDALQGHDGVMPALPMSDTVYSSDDGVSISGLLDRSKIFAGQAPELFDFEKYFDANEKLSEAELLDIKGSAQPAVMAGMDIAIIPGDKANIKITTREDLATFEHFLTTKKSSPE
ncbi:IspD/TarI family cytidylyltransferase [Butyrivibrio sp. WCD3002]|uniref:IspD/TarI family cytidylyltransferase n=1 Tax=Butyrivibrio sp. WCD3002 TaxID=1280676 RepID=UPI0004099CCF|nr:IspD/TarI family cytidylyltransferase [Butyrivibrio sp. WCD3002]